MALTNFILTAAAVSAAVLLLRSDVKQSATIFRRNMRHIRQWLEDESKTAVKIGGEIGRSAEGAERKELDSKVLKKEIPKDEKP